MGNPSCQIGVRRDGEPDDAVRQVAFEPGVNLRDILNSGSVRVRAACAGIGGCGLCRVRIDTGSAGPITEAESFHLSEGEIAEGVRLACQIIPQTSLDVSVLLQARPSVWSAPILAPYQSSYPIPVSGADADARLGVAVDLGTTSISVAICNLATGKRLAVRTGPNPQSGLCSDVVGRLQMASESTEKQNSLQSLAQRAISDGLSDLLRGEGLQAASVERLRVVGNTAMTTLLCGADPRPLLDPKHWQRLMEGDVFHNLDMATAFDLNPGTDVGLVPALGGFVGSDLILGVVHTQMIERPAPSALIDFGTNSEIGLWDGRRLWVTAAAGGPAFEGIGIGCGMTAGPGAIHRLFPPSNGVWEGESIEGNQPCGICGSGLIDLLAHLTIGGLIDERGRPKNNPTEVIVGKHRFTVSKADIDSLQQAKAAVASGLETLARLADIEMGDLKEIHVAGAFGDHLNLANAVAIGLLPHIPIERFRFAGNSALSGALDLVLSPTAEGAMRTTRDKAKLINLSMQDAYNDLFVDHLYLRPFPGEHRI